MDAVGAIKAPVGWAKARPLVFIGLVLLVAVGAVRFRQQLYGFPVLGGLLKTLFGGK